MNKRVAMISVHECPLASREGKERGGINVYVYELSKALSRLGWHVDAYTRVQDDINPRIVSVNDRFRVIHIPNGAHAPASKKEILATLPEFTRNTEGYIQENNLSYDIIHGHYYLSGLVAKELSTITKKQTPLVMTFHTLGLMKQLVAGAKDAEDPALRIPIEKDLITYASRIITSSDTGREYLSALYDAQPKKMVTIPPGVDMRLFRNIPAAEAKRRIGADANPHIILAVGRIDPVKGFDVLLVALKMLLQQDENLSEKLCLWIVGGDVEQSQNRWSHELKNLDRLKKMLNLSATVKFVAPQPQEELPYYYNAADVLVMPSHYESFGMVALEAIACGTQVIATDVTGISPLLKELPYGHIVSANNPIALAGQLREILKSPPREYATHESVEAFDWGSIAKQIADEYDRVVKL